MIRLAIREQPGGPATRLEGGADELEALLRARFPEALAPLPAPDLLGALDELERRVPGGAIVEAVGLDAALLRAYERTSYVVTLPEARGPPLSDGAGAAAEDDLLALRPGVPCPALAALPGADRFAWLTACNPFSQLVADERNRLRLALLRAALPAGLRALPARAVGDDPTWPPEPGFLVLGLGVEEGCAIGRRYGQNAILAGGNDGLPRVVPCFPAA